MSQLIDNLENKIKLNNNAISYVQQEKPKTQTDIDLFGPTCVKIDGDIVSIVAEINSLKTQIVTLASNAYAVGCGTTVGQTTVYPATVTVKSPNYSSETYSGNDPFGNTNSLLNASNLGIGSFSTFSNNDSSQASYGILYGTINSCFRLPCTSSACVSYASSITTLQSRITVLETQVNNLIPKANAVKMQKTEYELARYGQNQTMRTLNEKNAQISLALKYIKDVSPDTA